MAEVKNLDLAPGFADVIVDEIWAVHQFAHLRPFLNQTSHARKTGQQLNVLDQGTAKVGGSHCVIFGNMADDLGEIG
jgi:hypothetical protein